MAASSNSFDERAAIWDMNQIHHERSLAVAQSLKSSIPLRREMRALEYGAGTGILSFILKDSFKEILLMDTSEEMVRVSNEKIASLQTENIRAVVYDLVTSDCQQKFDIAYSQMTLHHIANVPLFISKVYDILDVNGWISIVDLYTEDGSFHDFNTNVHFGFDPELLKTELTEHGFKEVVYHQCFEMRKQAKNYPIFMIVGRK